MIYLKGQLICYTMSCMPVENCAWVDYEQGYSIMTVYREDTTTGSPVTTAAYEVTTSQDYMDDEQIDFDDNWISDQEEEQSFTEDVPVDQPEYEGMMDPSSLPGYVEDVTYEFPNDEDEQFYEANDDWLDEDVEESSVVPDYDSEEELFDDGVNDLTDDLDDGELDISDPEIAQILDDLANQKEESEERAEEIKEAELIEEAIEDGQLIDIWDSQEDVEPEDAEENPWAGMEIEDNTNESQKPDSSVDDGNDWIQMFKNNLRSSLASGRLIALIIIVSVIVIVTSIVLISYKCSQSRDKMSYRRLERGDKDAVRPLYNSEEA